MIKKAVSLSKKLLEKARVPNGERIRKRYEDIVNMLKLKVLLEEDITENLKTS